MIANSTDKPELPEDYNNIQEFNLTILITTLKQLTEIARLLRTKYYFHKIPENQIAISKERIHNNNNNSEILNELTKPNLLTECKEVLEKI